MVVTVVKTCLPTGVRPFRKADLSARRQHNSIKLGLIIYTRLTCPQAGGQVRFLNGRGPEFFTSSSRVGLPPSRLLGLSLRQTFLAQPLSRFLDAELDVIGREWLDVAQGLLRQTQGKCVDLHLCAGGRDLHG